MRPGRHCGWPVRQAPAAERMKSRFSRNSPGRLPTAPRFAPIHAWTLLDNFQWAEGHTERYGLIHTDFRSQKRTIKDSGLWYGRVAASNRLHL